MPISVKRIHDIEQILENEGVIHGRQFAMGAVAQNLFRQFPRIDREARREPALCFLAFEKESGEHQRLGVGQQVVAQQMPFEPLPQPARLDCEAADPCGLEFGSAQCPFDPIDDAERCWVGLPANSGAWGILGGPAADQSALPRQALPARGCQEIVEIMKIVEPQFASVRIVPRPGGRNAAGFVQKSHQGRAEKARPSRHGHHPAMRQLPRERNCIGANPGSVKPVHHPAINLHRLQMPHGVKVQGRVHAAGAIK